MTIRLVLLAAVAVLSGGTAAFAEGSDMPADAPVHHHVARKKAKPKAAMAAKAAPAPPAAPMMQPAPPPGGAPVAFDDLPPTARAALLAYYKTLATFGGDCAALSLGGFLMGIGPILKTEYNRDGDPDFLFTAPCARPVRRDIPPIEDALGAPQKILLSDPFGYHVSATFSAVFGRIQGRTALLSAVDCPDADAPDAVPDRCYAGRFWDPGKGLWGEVQPLRIATPPLRMISAN